MQGNGPTASIQNIRNMRPQTSLIDLMTWWSIYSGPSLGRVCTKLKAPVVVFQNILDVKEATVIYYKTWNIPIKSPHRSTGLQLLSTMKTVARAFKTGDTGTVGPKAGSV